MAWRRSRRAGAFCNGSCTGTIGPNEPRFTCAACSTFDLCLACAGAVQKLGLLHVRVIRWPPARDVLLQLATVAADRLVFSEDLPAGSLGGAGATTAIARHLLLAISETVAQPAAYYAIRNTQYAMGLTASSVLRNGLPKMRNTQYAIRNRAHSHSCITHYAIRNTQPCSRPIT